MILKFHGTAVVTVPKAILTDQKVIWEIAGSKP
jgi:hypothetical protein